MKKILIGIDPDLLKSGYCCIIDGKISELSTLSFFAMVEKIKLSADCAEGTESSILVYIEAGWLNNNVNHHSKSHKSRALSIGRKKGLLGAELERFVTNYTLKVGQRTSSNVGENHATGKLLEEAMKFYAIPYQLIKPTTSKWDSGLFKQITGLSERTNQEERDALKLIWGR